MDDSEEYFTEIIKRSIGGPDSTDPTYFEKNWAEYKVGISKKLNYL